MHATELPKPFHRDGWAYEEKGANSSFPRAGFLTMASTRGTKSCGAPTKGWSPRTLSQPTRLAARSRGSPMARRFPLGNILDGAIRPVAERARREYAEVLRRRYVASGNSGEFWTSTVA